MPPIPWPPKLAEDAFEVPRGTISPPTLMGVLWDAQKGRCWLCDCRMTPLGDTYPVAFDPHRPTFDHVWPQATHPNLGKFGVCLLACYDCNHRRGAKLPSDDDIRRLIAVYRRVPRWWMEKFRAQRDREAKRLARTAELVDLLLGQGS